MINLTKFGMILAVVALTSVAAIAIPTIVSAQNMTGGNMTETIVSAQNMTGGENMTADINQTGSISGRGGVTIVDIYDPPNPIR